MAVLTDGTPGKLTPADQQRLLFDLFACVLMYITGVGGAYTARWLAGPQNLLIETGERSLAFQLGNCLSGGVMLRQCPRRLHRLPQAPHESLKSILFSPSTVPVSSTFLGMRSMTWARRATRSPASSGERDAPRTNRPLCAQSACGQLFVPIHCCSALGYMITFLADQAISIYNSRGTVPPVLSKVAGGLSNGDTPPESSCCTAQALVMDSVLASTSMPSKDARLAPGVEPRGLPAGQWRRFLAPVAGGRLQARAHPPLPQLRLLPTAAVLELSVGSLGNSAADSPMGGSVTVSVSDGECATLEPARRPWPDTAICIAGPKQQLHMRSAAAGAGGGEGIGAAAAAPARAAAASGPSGSLRVRKVQATPLPTVVGDGDGTQHLHFFTAVFLAVALSIHSLLEARTPPLPPLWHPGRRSHAGSRLQGAAMGAQHTMKRTMDIMIAILAHKGLASYALGSTLIDSSTDDRRFMFVVLSFASATPIGILVGYVLSEVASGFVAASATALASGTFMYVAFMEVIPKEFRKRRHRVKKMGMLFGGFTLMSLLAIWA